MPERSHPRRRKKDKKPEMLTSKIVGSRKQEPETNDVGLDRSRSEPVERSIAGAAFDRKNRSDGETSGPPSQPSDSGFCPESQESGAAVSSQESARKRKMSAEDFGESVSRTTRRDELPSTTPKQKRPMSVLLTSDTDANADGNNASTSSARTSAICTICCVRPKDACFVHGRISHQVCCYPCAKMIFKNRGTCPVCRRKIEKITKNIVG